MTAKPFVVLVGNREVYRGDNLPMAQAHCVLDAPRGAEQSLHMVKNDATGEEWVGHRQFDGSWIWTRVGKPPQRQVDPDDWPEPPNRKDIYG